MTAYLLVYLISVISAHACTTRKHCGTTDRLSALIFDSENRLVANERPYTNFLHGTVPVHWCSHHLTHCDLGGVNSLCLPSGCPKSWCSLNDDCSVLNGHWSEWGAECSGIDVDGIRSRACNKPAPSDGGKGCIGNATRACTGRNKHLLSGCS